MKEIARKMTSGMMGVFMMLGVVIASSMTLNVMHTDLASAATCRCPDGTEGVVTTIVGGSQEVTDDSGKVIGYCTCDNGGGDSVLNILRLVVQIMTVLVGILAVVGITVVGIQYLTAGGNEEQTRKAKRRLFEIVIGIVVYVLLIAILTWLLPGFTSVWLG